MIATAIARKSMTDNPKPRCPICGSFMKSFLREPEQDCGGCGTIWALPQAY